MPEDTPNRGYTYPTYTDPADFPAQMEELATDIDTDVQTIIDQVDTARDEAPSAVLRDTVGLVIAAGAIIAPIDFDIEVYDNASMITGPGDDTFTIPVEGLYLLSSWIRFRDDTDVYDVSFGIRNNGSTRANQTYRTNDGATGIRISLTCLTYCFAGDVIDTVIRSNNIATLDERYFSATRMSGEGFLP